MQKNTPIQSKDTPSPQADQAVTQLGSPASAVQQSAELHSSSSAFGGAAGSASAQSSELLQFQGGGAGDVHTAAAQGTSGGGGTLPFQEQIQSAFGRHDVSNVQAYTGANAERACADMGAEAYATGEKIAFGTTPSLHTAAHEAAHTVQQKGGVSLAGGVGQAGDKYEQHADAVADLVVQGQSAEGLLDTMAGGSTGDAVQQKPVQRVAPPIVAALAALTIEQAAAIVGVVATVASGIGALTQARNNESKKGPPLKLKIDKNFLMGPVGQADLVLVAKALYFEECKALMKTGKSQTDIAGVAQANVKSRIAKQLSAACKPYTETRIENGAGGQTESKPWGSATISMQGGVVAAHQFSSTIGATAKEYGLHLDGSARLEVLKSCLVDFEIHPNIGYIADDDISVRGESIIWQESAKGNLEVMIQVAYDFDVDTVYSIWSGPTAVTPGMTPRIGPPTRKGEANPND